MSDMVMTWFRYRTLHSASVGMWEWKEFYVPKSITTQAAKESFFKQNYISELNDDLNTGTEHWRGIEYEAIPIPQHILQQKIDEHEARIASRTKALLEMKAMLPLCPIAELNVKPKKECTRWPNCGCLKQGILKDCRAPYKRP